MITVSDKSYNAGDGRDVKDKRVSNKFNKRDKEMVLRSLLSTRQGRDLIWEWLSHCHINKTSFTGNSYTFFNEGKRAVGLMILKDIRDADPSMYVNMELENRENNEHG